MKPSRLVSIISRFPKAKILVVGDLILDEYIWGSVDRISPEAPVPVVWANSRTYVPGGAANVAHNIAAMQANASIIGVVGFDKNRDILLSEFRKMGISAAGVFAAANRHTTLKTRIIAGHQQVVRVDWEHKDALSGESNKKILGYVAKRIDEFDAIIIEDYGKGVINIDLLGALIQLARAKGKIVTVDPKEEHFQYYRGVTSITPNRKELENAIRNLKIQDTTNKFRLNSDRVFNDKDIHAAACEIMRYLNLESMLVTLGEQGMQLFERDCRVAHIPTLAQEVFDVSGAGDTVISCFTLALCAGATKLEAAHIANFAAGIVVGKVGTAVANRKELLEKINKSNKS
jgi:rfaE bifunctional protein kinase chain/domain